MPPLDWLDASSLSGDEDASSGPRAALADVLAGLNPPQREAVEHAEGPLLIVAGPGSGKTRVITTRIAWLVLEQAVSPSEILAITFTNKAAREMRERVARLLPDVRGLWVATFHATCARILRREIEVLPGYTSRFTIYDTGDRNQLLKRLIKAADLDPTRFRPAAVGAWISEGKNRHGLAEDTDSSFEGEAFARVRAAYETAMRENNALDFDDLLLKTVEIFERFPGVRDAYARRFRYVMVDEYQDTNHVQYLLTAQLASAHGNLAVCGDPDQSIYAWRGADIRNILDFEEDFGARKVVKLEQNYRSTGHILAAASAVVSHNRGRKPKALWTAAPDGERLTVLECGDENDEAYEVAARIRALVAREGRRPSEAAIFYRANFMQRALETALTRDGMPYQIVGGTEFYARREIKDLVALLRLTVNPADDEAFRRIVNVPARGVGPTSLERFAEDAAARGMPLARALFDFGLIARVRGRARRGLELFQTVVGSLEEFRDAPAALALKTALDVIDRDRWLAEMDDGSGSADREANIDELLAHAAEYDRENPDGRLGGFLEDVALVSDVDAMDDALEKVALMTLHSAKGLEFPFVFIVGLEDEILPHARALAEASDSEPEEEERRLLYVGMTRARERLWLSHVQTRHVFGQHRWSRPSRFLEEIPPELIEGGGAAVADAAAADDALGAYEAPGEAPDLAVGVDVRHPTFGRGRVERLSGRGANARATVRFREGTKELLLQYARLERIGS